MDARLRSVGGRMADVWDTAAGKPPTACLGQERWATRQQLLRIHIAGVAALAGWREPMWGKDREAKAEAASRSRCRHRGRSRSRAAEEAEAYRRRGRRRGAGRRGRGARGCGQTERRERRWQRGQWLPADASWVHLQPGRNPPSVSFVRKARPSVAVARRPGRSCLLR